MLLGKMKSDYFKNKKGGGAHVGLCPYFWTERPSEEVLKYR